MSPTSRRRARGRVLALIAGAVLGAAACGAPDAPPVLPADDPAARPATDSPAVRGPAPASAPHEDRTPTLTAEGWGPIRIGMTRAEVVAAAGADANPDAVGGPEPEVCDEFRPVRAPDGMLVMVERDRVTRITLSAGTGITTEEGLGVGDPAAAIREAYGTQAVTSPHKYWPAPAEYITVWTSAPGTPEARGLVYEVGPDGRVVHVHAGGASIQYVEGCL